MKHVLPTLLPTLLVSLTSLFASAQSLETLKKQYQQVSPISYDRLQTTHLVNPEESSTTPEEERLAELKAQEQAEKQAREERVYLDTDFKFFQSLAVPMQEDELDKLFKKDLVEKDLEQARVTDSTVKGEIKTTTPVPMSRAEGVAADQRRQKLMSKVAENARTIKACILENNKKGIPFKGSEMTLVWDVTTAGKVEAAKISSTDVTSSEIQKCVLKSMSEWSFAEAMQINSKKSRVLYTFRFTKETSTELASKGQERNPGSEVSSNSGAVRTIQNLSAMQN